MHCRSPSSTRRYLEDKREFDIAGSSFEDRLLDIVVFEQMDMGTLGKNIARSFAPKKQAVTSLSPGEKRTFTYHPAELSGIPGMHHVQARGVTIMTSADPREATFDGEVRGHTPIYVHVADKQLRVRIPDHVKRPDRQTDMRRNSSNSSFTTKRSFDVRTNNVNSVGTKMTWEPSMTS